MEAGDQSRVIELRVLVVHITRQMNISSSLLTRWKTTFFLSPFFSVIKTVVIFLDCFCKCHEKSFKVCEDSKSSSGPHLKIVRVTKTRGATAAWCHARKKKKQCEICLEDVNKKCLADGKTFFLSVSTSLSTSVFFFFLWKLFFFKLIHTFFLSKDISKIKHLCINFQNLSIFFYLLSNRVLNLLLICTKRLKI